MKTRQTIHALFGITLILEIFLGGYNIAHAQINTGVEASIRDFLCTPAVKNANNQTVRTTQGAIPLDGGPKVSSTKNTQLITCINRIYRFSVYVASIAAVFLFVWAGYMYMTDSGDEKRVTTARSIMFSTIIGLIILASTYVMLRFINPDLVNIPEFSAVDAGIVTDDQIDQLFRSSNSAPPTQGSVVTSGNFPFFKQAASPWGPMLYGNCGPEGTIANAGCGPSSLAAVITYYQQKGQATGGPVDPGVIAKIAVEKGYRVCGSGSSPSMMAGIAPSYGLKGNEVGWTKAKQLLSQGTPVIGRMGPGYFTSGGHYVVLYGIDANSKILVADSGPRNITEADESIVTAQAKDFYYVGP